MSAPKFTRGDDVIWEKTGEQGEVISQSYVETEEYGYVIDTGGDVAKLALESELKTNE